MWIRQLPHSVICTSQVVSLSIDSIYDVLAHPGAWHKNTKNYEKRINEEKHVLESEIRSVKIPVLLNPNLLFFVLAQNQLILLKKHIFHSRLGTAVNVWKAYSLEWLRLGEDTIWLEQTVFRLWEVETHFPS
jgi:hypothetical protein